MVPVGAVDVVVVRWDKKAAGDGNIAYLLLGANVKWIPFLFLLLSLGLKLKLRFLNVRYNPFPVL